MGFCQITSVSPFWGYGMTGDVEVRFMYSNPFESFENMNTDPHFQLSAMSLVSFLLKIVSSSMIPILTNLTIVLKILNIVSKFTFIIWMQRMKMVHQRKLEAARELYGLSPTDDVAEDELKAKATTQKAQLGVGWRGCEIQKCDF